MMIYDGSAELMTLLCTFEVRLMNTTDFYQKQKKNTTPEKPLINFVETNLCLQSINRV